MFICPAGEFAYRKESCFGTSLDNSLVDFFVIPNDV